MRGPARFRRPPERIAVAAVAGLLLALVLAGLVGLALDIQVRQVTDSALRYDVELEDEGDDLRVAVLDLRHHHRNLVFAPPSERTVAALDHAYAALLEEIADLERLAIRDPEVPEPARIREMAESYFLDFRPAVDLARSDPAAFDRASDLGLARLGALDQTATRIDKLGEERATAALESVERASTTAGLVLLALLVGLVIVGATLAYVAVRVVRALQARNDFVANVSHELRAPLLVLRGNAEVGLALEGNSMLRPRLEQIVEEAARMAALLEDLLFLARSDSAAGPLELEPVAVAPFLAELAGRAEMLAHQHGVALEAAVPGGEGQILIDRARIEQVVLNLVDNAAKYSPPGGRVTLSAATSSDELRVEVADQGPGIPEEDLPRIFDPFYRADKKRTRRQAGVGLGLAIVKTIAAAHGGRVEVASRLGEGTRISVSLPLQSARQPGGELVDAGDAGTVDEEWPGAGADVDRAGERERSRQD